MAIIEQEFLDLARKLDAPAFWEENARCHLHTTAKPRCPAALGPDDHWLFEFMGVPSTLRYYRDKPYRDRLHRETNELCRRHLGVAFFGEDTWEHSPRRIENLFGCEFEYTEGSTPWLRHVTDNPKEFARILDEAEGMEMERWALPEPYLAEWERRRDAGETMPRMGGGSRGPATIMTSVIKPEILFGWMADHPDLVARFAVILAGKMVELNRVLRRFSGNTEAGWWITDDNCCLFSPRLYETYCYPVLEKVLDELAPGSAMRYQHSDSAMAHIIPLQRRLGIKRVNYGPEVDAGLIREQMPDAWIDGHMPPFLLRNGSPDAIRKRVREDFLKAGQTGMQTVTTAGSLAAGTGLGRARWFLLCVEECCRYEC